MSLGTLVEHDVIWLRGRWRCCNKFDRLMLMSVMLWCAAMRAWRPPSPTDHLDASNTRHDRLCSTGYYEATKPALSPQVFENYKKLADDETWRMLLLNKGIFRTSHYLGPTAIQF
jgi:hypothetical protein